MDFPIDVAYVSSTLRFKWVSPYKVTKFDTLTVCNWPIRLTIPRPSLTLPLYGIQKPARLPSTEVCLKARITCRIQISFLASTPCPLHITLMWPPHIHTGVPYGLFLWGLPTKNFAPVAHTSDPSHYPWLTHTFQIYVKTHNIFLNITRPQWSHGFPCGWNEVVCLLGGHERLEPWRWEGYVAPKRRYQYTLQCVNNLQDGSLHYTTLYSYDKWVWGDYDNWKD